MAKAAEVRQREKEAALARLEKVIGVHGKQVWSFCVLPRASHANWPIASCPSASQGTKVATCVWAGLRVFLARRTPVVYMGTRLTFIPLVFLLCRSWASTPA